VGGAARSTERNERDPVVSVVGESDLGTVRRVNGPRDGCQRIAGSGFDQGTFTAGSDRPDGDGVVSRVVRVRSGVVTLERELRSVRRDVGHVVVLEVPVRVGLVYQAAAVGSDRGDRLTCMW